MERAEAEAIYDAGRDAVVELLLRFDARITELEARLKADSTNSSRPPSSDGLSKRPATPRERGKRSPGKQPGERGRYLRQVTEPDTVVEHVPVECEACGAGLSRAPVVRSEVRQVADLPPVELVWTEHRSHRKRCSCGHVTAGAFPPAVSAPTQYGPRMRAVAGYLCSHQHVPYDRARQAFEDLLGARVSLGWVANAVHRISDTVAPIAAQIKQAVGRAGVVHFDETGVRVEGRLHWVHVSSTQQLAYLERHPQRGRTAMLQVGILPAFEGVAVHDGLKSYKNFSCDHALCGAHHLRELRGVAELYKNAWASEMDTLLRDIKTHVDQAKARGEHRLPGRFKRHLLTRYDDIIERARSQVPPPVRVGKRGFPRRTQPANLHRRLDQQRSWVLRFMTDFRVPFDNNIAERDLRMLKVQQKISGGWRTTHGADRHLALRSYLTTARRQGQHVLDTLTSAAHGTTWQPAGT